MIPNVLLYKPNKNKLVTKPKQQQPIDTNIISTKDKCTALPNCFNS